MKKETCCFTGHRKIRKGDEAAIRIKIREQVLPLLEQGVSTFMVGGAMGFDMLAAETLLDLREKEGKELRLISALRSCSGGKTGRGRRLSGRTGSCRAATRS